MFEHLIKIFSIVATHQSVLDLLTDVLEMFFNKICVKVIAAIRQEEKNESEGFPVSYFIFGLYCVCCYILLILVMYADLNHINYLAFFLNHIHFLTISSNNKSLWNLFKLIDICKIKIIKKENKWFWDFSNSL